MKTVVYFIRHAEPDYSVHDDVIRPLTDKGKKDAVKVATYLKDKGIEVALSSPYKRAIDTIKPFVETNNINVELVENFRERKVDSCWIDDFHGFAQKQGVKILKIGVIGPTETEIVPFISKIKDKKLSEHAKLKFYSGVFEGVEVVSVFCGVCKVNATIATQLLINKFEVTHIVLTGVAGALNGQLKIGDIVIASEVAYHDVSSEILTEYHPWMEDIYFKPDNRLLKLSEAVAKSLLVSHKCHIGRIITGETFITHNEREHLIQAFKPLCVDMESASVAHTCFVNDLPFIVIRSMSDNADENGSETFENNIEMAALNSLALVEALIKKLRIS